MIEPTAAATDRLGEETGQRDPVPVSEPVFESVPQWPFEPGLWRGRVWHRRHRPAVNHFDYPVVYVWIDPDRPEDLTDLHWAWSTGRLRPARITRSDYGRRRSGSLADEVRQELEPVLGGRAVGPVRILTQARRWGWLFNPISIYFAWPDGSEPAATAAVDGAGDPVDPIGAVLEVTNTPWKERHRYPLALSAANGTLTARFDKRLHVSPFLDNRHHYDLTIRSTTGTITSNTSTPNTSTPNTSSPDTGADDGAGPVLTVTIDVVPGASHPSTTSDPSTTTDFTDGDRPVLTTGFTVAYSRATPRVLARSLMTDGFPTHRVSTGIHRQALQLWRQGVAFVPHPKRKASDGHPQP